MGLLRSVAALSFPNGIPKLKWIPKDNATITIYNIGFTQTTEPLSSRPQLKVQCQRFQKTAEACTTKSWLGKGGKVDLKLPPYAMPRSQIKALKDQINPLLEAHFGKLLAELKFDQDDVISLTISEASRHFQHVSTHGSL